ncbi:MAG TPA: hypothetical protein VKA94_07220 [Hyphomicrobiales bacterium]|nr:hypothetical protein [Hyphomicrobiales bacterium]
MGRFLLGLVIGIALSFGYVRWGIALPDFLTLPERLRGNIVSTAIEEDLYDLGQPIETRRRALEVFFASRSKFAVEVDAEYGHPFLNALYRKRATHEARLLRGQWVAFDMALKKPALRPALEKKHGVSDDLSLKQAMLFSAYQDKPFLVRWVAEQVRDKPTPETLLPLIKKLSVLPQ